MRPAKQPSRHPALEPALLLVACFACYGNTIGHDYAYDDAVVITENSLTQKGIAGIPEIFSHNTFAGSYQGVPLLERYRPLSLATFALERDLFGPSPHVGHFVNVLLFALVTWLLLAFLRRALIQHQAVAAPATLPFIAALLFAVHPVHTEVVANIKGRDELVVLAGGLSALLFVLGYLDGRRRLHLVLAFACFAVAVFAKENALTLLAVAPLTIFFFRQAKARDYLVSLLPLVLAAAVFLVVRRAVLAGTAAPVAGDLLTDPLASLSGSQRLATIVYCLGAYLGLLVFPHPLTIDYHPFHIKPMGWDSVAVWLAVLAYAALAVVAVRGVRKRSLDAYGILFYLATLSVVSNLPFSTGTFMSERFVFLPSVGFVVVLAGLLTSTRFATALRSRRLVKAVLVALVLAAAVKTYVRNAVWKDDFTLLTTDAATSKASVKANMAATVAYLVEANKPGPGNLAHRTRALQHAKQAVAAYEENVEPARRKGSFYAELLTLLGNAYGENGLVEEALRCYRAALGDTARRESLEEMIQAAIDKSDDVDVRLATTLEFARLVPDSFIFNYHLGLLYGKDKHDLPMAIAYFRKAVDLAPGHVDALRGLGHAYSLANQLDQAALCFEKLAAQHPADPSYLRSLLELYRRAGNPAKVDETARRLQAMGE